MSASNTHGPGTAYVYTVPAVDGVGHEDGHGDAEGGDYDEDADRHEDSDGGSNDNQCPCTRETILTISEEKANSKVFENE